MCHRQHKHLHFFKMYYYLPFGCCAQQHREKTSTVYWQIGGFVQLAVMFIVKEFKLWHILQQIIQRIGRLDSMMEIVEMLRDQHISWLFISSEVILQHANPQMSTLQ